MSLKQMFYDELRKIVDCDYIKINESMRNHTTLKMGGNASILIEPNEEELPKVMKLIKECGLRYRIIGRGSNILVSDEGLNAIVIKIADRYSSVAINKTSIVVSAGVPISYVSKIALANKLTGSEFASGIPGTVGGAVVMNAGAYGGEVKDIIEWVTIMKEDGSIVKMSNEDMKFSYRKSILTDNPNWIVLAAKFNLEPGVEKEIFEQMQARNQKRVISQPLHQHNCGSVFKRIDGTSAGKLIDDCGLKGFTYNGVEISSKHANFIVNNGNSTAKDMLYVIEVAKKAVKEKFGIVLEEEVKMFE